MNKKSNQLNEVKNALIRANTAYMNYYEDNVSSWDEINKDIALKTIGVLVMGVNKTDEFIEHYSKTEDLPSDVEKEEDMIEFIEYFNTLSLELLKRIPEEYFSENYKPKVEDGEEV